MKSNAQDIVILCGSPGAGKSTFYWKHLEPLGYARNFLKCFVLDFPCVAGINFTAQVCEGQSGHSENKREMSQGRRRISEGGVVGGSRYASFQVAKWLIGWATNNADCFQTIPMRTPKCEVDGLSSQSIMPCLYVVCCSLQMEPHVNIMIF